MSDFMMASFRVPPEPRPLSSLDSDEESFVVLGKSLCPEDEPDTPDSEGPPSKGPLIETTALEEAKKLIGDELKAMEKNGGAPPVEEHLLQICPQKLEDDNMTRSEKGAELPEMPFVSKGFDTTNTISIMTFSSDLTSEETQNKIAQIIEENIRLKDTILQNNMSMKSQYERIIVWQEEVQKVHQVHKDKILEAKDIIEKLKKENASLHNQLQRLSIAAPANEMQEIVQKLTTENMQLTEDSKKQAELIAQLNQMKLEDTEAQTNKQAESYLQRIQDLELELADLKKQLALAKQYEIQLVTATDQIRNLQQTISELEVTIASQDRHQSALLQEELTNVRTQLANTQIELTRRAQSESAANLKVESLSKEIRHLNGEIEKLKKNLDQVQRNEAAGSQDENYALKTQLEVYKADFEAEAAAKSSLKQEKEKLLEDMQNLQRRNHQLQEEIELIRENRDFHVYTPPNRTSSRTSSNRSSTASAPPPSPEILKCPTCSFGFRTVSALENHVYRCIDLNEHLP